MKDIKNICVIGLGLIGGSLALSLKNLNNDFKIKGFDASLDSMNIAKYRNIIDEISSRIEDAVGDADLIIIATPISKITKVASQIKDHLKPGAIVTDVGSAKKKDSGTNGKNIAGRGGIYRRPPHGRFGK